MKITENDIIRTARQLRDEENEQFHVRPWRRSRRFHIPAWLVAVPAAAIIGFVLGIWTNTHTQDNAPLTALVDTVYVKTSDAPVAIDTIVPVRAPQQRASEKEARPKTIVRQHQPRHEGKSIAYDQIRYDLLVRN